MWQMDLEATKGDKRRQLAANCQRQKASYCDKFIAAFCRFLPLGFEQHFFQTISLGDGVIVRTDTARMVVRYVE